MIVGGGFWQLCPILRLPGSDILSTYQNCHISVYPYATLITGRRMMTEYEYLELITLLRENMGFHSMNVFGVLAAYVMVVYFSGRELSAMQISVITVLYSLFLTLPIGAMRVSVSNLIDISQKYVLEFPDRVVSQIHAPNALLYFIPYSYIIAWAASILFMVQWRSRGTE
jgi:hypothetical protein